MAVDFTSTTEGATQVVNGRVYTYTGGAWRAESAESAVAATITNGDATHAPSGDAVFDALALKFDKTGGGISGSVKVGTPDNSFSGTTTTLSVSAGQSGDNTAGMNIEGSRSGSGQLFGRFGFWHQGTLVASFNAIRGAADEGSFAIATKTAGGGLAFRWQVAPTGHLLPWADNAYDQGSASARVREFHGGAFYSAGLQVVGARNTGWSAPTGTATKTTFATSTVTLPQLAERVKALTDALIAHGLIGT